MRTGKLENPLSIDVGSDADGDIYQRSSGKLVRLAKGDALALLKMNSAGTAVEWGTAGQIAFPATAVPSSDPNTLDDYEEGTWTAAFVASTSGTITAGSNVTCRYVKTGSQVSFSGHINVASVSSPVGEFEISGLPFTVGSGEPYRFGFSVYSDGLAAAATTSLQGYCTAGGTKLTIRKFAAGSSAMLASDVQANTLFIIGGVYFI